MKDQSAYRFDRAIVRAPAPSVVGGVRAGDGDDPSYDGVATEHAAYIGALQQAGVEVSALPALKDFPDSLFVEDPALVFTGAAILLQTSAPSRAGEAAMLAPTLHEFFEQVLSLREGYVDGGDVLMTREEVLIGLSGRTDRTGAQGLAKLLNSIGRQARIVETPPDILHFKSDCGLLDDETVLATGRLARTEVFGEMKVIVTPDGEDGAANALRINEVVLLGERFPKTAELLDRSGYDVVSLATGEIAKVDAGLSCMSLRWSSIA